MGVGVTRTRAQTAGERSGWGGGMPETIGTSWAGALVEARLRQRREECLAALGSETRTVAPASPVGGQAGRWRSVEWAYGTGAEAAVRAAWGIVPQSEQLGDGEAGVASHDVYEGSEFAEEMVVGPAERERLMAQLAPWDHEEGNSFE